MTCRFCHHDSLVTAFPGNKLAKKLKIPAFACTNSNFGLHGPIVRCRHCHLYYVDEKISQKAISTYYEVAEDPLYFAESPAREKTFRRYLRKIEAVFPRKGKLLDVGTNTGLFVRIALDNGWDAVGVEPNRWAVEYAKKNYHVDLIAKPFTKNAFPKGSFDVVTMWDVIEHFTDPVSRLDTVYSLLKPGGLFVFSTVDPESTFAKVLGTKWPWYMDMHRVFLPRPAAKYYLQKTGFKKIQFQPHWRFLSAGYLATRLAAISATMAKLGQKILKSLGLTKVILPYFANDLYDAYAFK